MVRIKEQTTLAVREQFLVVALLIFTDMANCNSTKTNRLKYHQLRETGAFWARVWFSVLVWVSDNLSIWVFIFSFSIIPSLSLRLSYRLNSAIVWVSVSVWVSALVWASVWVWFISTSLSFNLSFSFSLSDLSLSTQLLDHERWHLPRLPRNRSWFLILKFATAFSYSFWELPRLWNRNKELLGT